MKAIKSICYLCVLNHWREKNPDVSFWDMCVWIELFEKYLLYSCPVDVGRNLMKRCISLDLPEDIAQSCPYLVELVMSQEAGAQ
jgi:hypothetical protein